MKRILLLSFAFITAISFSVMAQRTVSGKITDESGEPLPGVNVVIKGTTTGTQTDLDGNYRLSVEDGATLVFSYVGFQTQELEVGSRTTIDVSMGGATELQEVVVTAVGIERDKKALGYAVSTFSNEDIEQKADGDLGRVLRGKAPGVDVTQTNGMSGSGTNIVIRGYTSITQSNQPLFVVDGVPFNSETNNGNNFVDGQTESSRFLDLDPNSIASVNVLKGLSATVLYGEQGRNGVILITTKNGSQRGVTKKTEVTVSQSYFATEIASLPDYQNNYGGGFYQNFGFFFSNWGPNFDEIETVSHPYGNFTNDALQESFSEFVGADYEYRPYTNTENFFQTGSVATTSINIRGGNETSSFNVSYGYTDDEGFTPGNTVQRHNFGFGGSSQLSNGIKVGGSFNYAFTDYKSPPLAASQGSGTTGDGSSVFGDVFYTPRSVDLNGLPYQDPVTGGSVYYRSGNDIQNPRWTIENAGTTQRVNRLFGNAYVGYDITENINVTFKAGLDTYNEFNTAFQNRGGVDGNVNALNGIYRTVNRNNTITNYDLIIRGSKDISQDFSIVGTLGTTARKDVRITDGVESTGQIAFGVLEHYNFTSQSAVNSGNGLNIPFESEQKWLGVYGQAELSFRSYLYLTLSGRNDWVNTLESGNNSLFYAGASIAFDATTAIAAIQNSDALNYLKLRFGYGSSAGFPTPYNTRNTITLNSQAFVPFGATSPTISNNVANRLGNPDLTPERIGEFEVGIETRLFNRASLDISAYKKTTTDLILDQDLDPATGYTTRFVNAGELEVEGIEASLSGNILTAGAFAWDLQANFTSYNNTITNLPDETELINIAGFTNLGNVAVEGESYGSIYGSVVDRDAQGRRLVDATGNYVQATDPEIIGDPIPDFTTAITNSFGWKGLKLNVVIQYQKGGDFYSGTARALLARGLTKDTDFDRRNTFILPGVTSDGSVNTVQIAATDLYFNNLGFGPSEHSVFDATSIRLQEVSLSYSLPKSIIQNTPFGNVEFTASGYNLWYDAVNLPEHTNVDPNALGTGVGNGLGFEFLNAPSAKRYGGSIKVTF